jgi:methyl-accepting chemotaxis protein
MAKLDSTSLDEKENQVAELVKTDPAKAIAFYLNEYTPVRKTQNENFVKLKKLSQVYSENIIQKDKEQRKSLALMTIALLILSTFAGVLVSYFVAISITKNTNEVLNFFKLTSDELSDQSSALLDKSRSLSDATNLESAAIQETAASIHEITQMADKTTENSNLSRTLSSDSSSKSRDGVSAIEKMIQSIDEINNYQGEIVDVVETSNKRISEIVSVISNIEAKTKVINEIVFQTKLLSFNASVEAARAGENGKGFAVVAEEIGNLANLSGTASSEINALLSESVRSVNGIVSSTQDSLKRSMDKSKTLIQNGKKIAEECSDVLMAIDKSVSNTSIAIEEITIATKEQSRGISEINIAVGQLDNTIQSNSNIAKDAHVIANVLSKKSNELQSRVDDLNLLINGK